MAISSDGCQSLSELKMYILCTISLISGDGIPLHFCLQIGGHDTFLNGNSSSNMVHHGMFNVVFAAEEQRLVVAYLGLQ